MKIRQQSLLNQFHQWEFELLEQLLVFLDIIKLDTIVFGGKDASGTMVLNFSTNILRIKYMVNSSS